MKKLIILFAVVIGMAATAQEGITVSLLMPLERADGQTDRRFVEFYRGALLAAEELEAQGVVIGLKLFDAPRDSEAIYNIVDSPEFSETDVVIGPVYQEGLEVVTAWARGRGIPVVSPLSSEEAFGEGVLFGMAPAPQLKYDGLLATLRAPDANVVYVRTSKPDVEMDSLLLPMLADAAAISYNEASRGAQFEGVIRRGAAENIFVVSCTDARLVDGILGRISSTYNNLRARGATSSRVRVVGTPEWAWFPSSTVDRELYFKLGVTYLTNYHVDRTDARVRAFDGRYIARFGDVPPSATAGRTLPYAYRGYDAVRLFAGATAMSGGDYVERVNRLGDQLLETRYRFEPTVWGGWRNVEWPMVEYTSDYSIIMGEREE